MPNSLIFAVILAVWAAYLIQHWIRRRDHVATARSVDRFSEAMRVLERRQSSPRADLTAPAPRSYAVSLTRPAHPEVVVKRARHGDAGSAPRRTRRRLPRPSAAVLRAVVLVVGVLALAAGVTVWLLGRTPWWGGAAGGGALLLSLAFVRLSVGRQRRRDASPVRPSATRAKTRRRAAGTADGARRTRSADRPASTRRRPARPAAARRRGARPARVGGARPATAQEAPTAAALAPAAALEGLETEHDLGARPPERVHPDGTLTQVATHEPADRDQVQFFDVEAHEVSPGAAVHEDNAGSTVHQATATERSAGAGDPVELAPGTWAPVPVPPPTYTLKARASRPTAHDPRAQQRPERIEDLPFDGHALVFDEEFEDLPPVHSVG